MSIVLVTGASSGLGRAATERLARAGHTVWAAYRGIDGKNAAATTDLLRLATAEDLKIRVVELDVTSDESVNAAVKSVLEQDGRIDVLLNNAGRMYSGLVETFSPEQVLRQLDTNVVGSFRVAKAVLPSMRANKSGLLLHTSSVFGRVTSPFAGVYAASKFAVEGMFQALAEEVYSLGIDTTLLEAGPFRTNVGMSGEWPADAALAAEYGAVGQGFQAWIQGFGQFMAQPIPELEPSLFAEEVLALVNAAPGTRPIRKVVGLKYGVDVLNQATEPFERGMVEGQQLGFLLTRS